MSIYERDYERQAFGRPPGIHLGGERSVTTNLVIFTFGVYVAQLLFKMPFTDLFLLHANWYEQPWRVFELLTYGFLHSPNDLRHIVFNMLGLWMFGRSVEGRLGRREYFVFYLVAIVFAGVCWNVATLATGGVGGRLAGMLGASGGLAAVLLLFAMLFPHQKVYFLMAIPMPAWIFAILFVGMDLMGALNRTGNVAYTAHLGGAAFAVLYRQFGWRLADGLPTGFRLPQFGRGPRLRVHKPQDDDSRGNEVDEILRKIQRDGQDSLTSRERRILEKASYDYQKKRK